MIDYFTQPRYRRFALGPFIVLWIGLLAGVTGPCVRAAEASTEMSPRAKASKKNFDIPAGDALTALKRFFAQSGEQLIYKAESLDGIRTEAVRGSFTAREALERMLSRTALSVAQDEKNGVLAIVPAASANGKNRSADSTSATDVSSKKKVEMTMKAKNPIALLVSWLVLSSAPSHTIQAADSSSAGTIEGRVSNPANGEYLERARVTAEGTSLETFTDSAGFYRLTNVPPGTAKVNVFYTGFGVQGEEVRVSPGETVHHDIAMAADEGGVVRLDKFMVSTSREMTAAAIAINEQRFAPNIKGVVAADEYGDVAGGNVGEFLKFLPGITIDFAIGARARGVSINGVPAAYVPVTVNGFNLAKGPDVANDRSMTLDMLSITAISRIEVIYSPTPESQGSALGGSVNLVPPSAFERSRPEFKYDLFLMMRDNARDFDKSPGPLENPTRKVTPGFEFSYIRPVNNRFGFTLSGGHSKDGSNDDQIRNTWRGVTAATNGNAFPHTTPDRPYLTSTQVQVGTKLTSRNSFGATADYKLTSNDQLSFSYQFYDTDLLAMNRTLSFNITAVAPGDFTPTSTRGSAGQGNLQLVKHSFRRHNRIHTPSLVWRHNGPVWKGEAGVGFSRGTGTFRDIDHGYFRSSTARRTGVTISFADIFYLRPNTITVTDATGQPLDPYNINNYVVTAATDRPITSLDRQKGAYASVTREFFGRRPFSIKAGVDFREAEREQRAASNPYTFVGADGRASTAPAGSDDLATPFFATSYSRKDIGFGFPRVQWIDNGKLWNYYQANPTHVRFNANAGYRSAANSSVHAVELVSSGYLRGDLHLLDRRLHLTGGVRAEQTNVEAEGQLADPTRNYRRDARGNVILVNGAPQLIVPTSNALGVSELTVIDRGRKAEKEYLRWFPSLNASFNLRDNLIARAAYYESIGRPDFTQYGGALTLPDIARPPTPTNRIAVNNAAIKPWSAKTISMRLEYYFEGVGQISVGAFRRDFENFFGNTVFRATGEFLGLNGLDPNLYGAYDVATQHNIQDNVRMTGVDVSYKQALTFLPHWARGVTAFANGAVQRAEGEASANFAGYIPRKASWGISLTRERFNVRMNWTYQSRNRRGAVAPGPSIGPGTFNWQSKRGFLDILGEYYFTPRFGVYATLRNVGDTPDELQAEGPSTPAASQFVSRLYSGSLWTFGVKGTF